MLVHGVNGAERRKQKIRNRKGIAREDKGVGTIVPGGGATTNQRHPLLMLPPSDIGICLILIRKNGKLQNGGRGIGGRATLRSAGRHEA